MPDSCLRLLEAGVSHNAATQHASSTVDPVKDVQEPQQKLVSRTSSSASNAMIPDIVNVPGRSSQEVETEKRPKAYTAQEVTAHTSEKDLWIIIGSDVYDVTEFQHQHPGGAKVIHGVAGKDATKKFDRHHRRGLLEPYKAKYQVGVLAVTSPPKDHGNPTENSSNQEGLAVIPTSILVFIATL
ncbi:acyl-CoA dehydrogenase [Apiospora rasikravindrae]|uniref:Acyl-CoA dehydrogenase n=1 Tax=Apiospora rasikravindrae TaxID=990691 RepID=A0ABR1T7L0_9PEZI